MAVGIDRQNLPQHRHFDPLKRAARGDVIGVKHWLRPERPLDHDILADQLLAQAGTDVPQAKAFAETFKEQLLCGQGGCLSFHAVLLFSDFELERVRIHLYLHLQNHIHSIKCAGTGPKWTRLTKRSS